MDYKHSQQLAARNLVSRSLGLRSLVSRNFNNSGMQCCNYGLSENDSYNWGDIFNKTLTLRVPVTAYNLPDLSTPYADMLPGYPIKVHSYVNRDGITWIMFHINQVDYDNFNGSYIPLVGSPGSINTVPVDTLESIFDPKSDDPMLLTTHEQESANMDFWQKAEKFAGSMLLWGSIAVIGSKLIKPSQGKK